MEHNFAAVFEKECRGRKSGLLISAGAAFIAVLLSMPFVKWFHVVQADALYSNIGLKADAIAKLKSGYSIFDLLSFVQYTKLGGLGLYSMLILLGLAVALYFNAKLFLQVLHGHKGIKGSLSTYVTARLAFGFNIVLSLAAIIYQFFASHVAGTTVFFISPVVYLILVISFAAYLMVKSMEKTERRFYGEYGFWHELRKNWVLFVMLIPAAAYLLINNYLPMAGIYYAFTSFNFRDGLWASPFFGMKNFEHLFRADLFKLTKNTILYNFAFIVIGNILQIIFAVFISQAGNRKFKRTAQTLMFMPYFVSFVVLKVFVYNLFEYDSGVINTMLVSMGGEKVDFYNIPGYWPFLITIFYLWKNIGYGMVIYLATILGINDEYYDAAKVDGASLLQQIRYITLPLIKPTFIILFLYSMGSIMKGQFELFYQIVGTNGVLFNATDIFDTYVYRITMTQPLSIGIGTAAGLYQSLFGFIVIIITNYVVKRRNPEYALF